MTPPSLPAVDRPLSILVVNPDVPPPDRDSGSLRLFRLLELLADDGHRLTLVGRIGVGQADAVRAVEALGVEVHPVDAERAPVPVAAPPLDLHGLIARVRPDVAWLSFFSTAEVYLPLLRRWTPATKVVVDTVDVHWVREARAAELSGSAADAVQAQRTRAREADAYAAADALVAVSDDDAAALRELAPEVPVSVISNVHPPEPEGAPRAARDGVLFIGNFRHTPNVDAALHVVHDVWPLVRAQLPGARLQLVGTAPPPAVQALAALDVEVTGWVPDTKPYLDGAAVSVAPLRYGAGVKGKIGEALAHGLPVVTTTIGAEGMDLQDGRDALVADAPQDFAAAIVALHSDAALWERLARDGRAAIERRLSPEAARAGLRALLAGVAPRTFLAADALHDAAAVDAALAGYLAAFAPGDRVSLAIPAPPDQPLDALFGTLVATIGALGHDPETIPDVAVSPWPAEAVVPADAVVVGGPEAALAADAPPAAWRAAAQPSATRPAVRASLVVRLPHEADEAAAQLDAVLAAGVPADVELLLAVGDGHDAGELLCRCPGARVVRAEVDAGRARTLRRAAYAARGETVVVLEPHALPQPDFLGPLLAAIAGGAVLAGAVVDGACGYRAEADGTLSPLRAGEGDPEVLALDCLAARRSTWLQMPMALPSREGHAETQLAAWAATRGRLAVAGGALVRRAPVPDATVIVCTRNRADVLTDTVELVVAQGAAEVLVVDNGSTDDTPAVAAELAARHPRVVRVVEEPQAGLSHARNAGARAATHELLVFLDDDARPAPGWLSALVRELARPGVVSTGGPIVGLWPAERPAEWPAHGLEPLYGVLDYGDADRTVVAPIVVYGGNWCVRRTALEAVGGFDPSFGVGPNARIGGEEVSVTWRLQRAGLGATRYVAAGGVGHLIQASRLNERFLVQRALTVGLERPRYLEHPSRSELAETAGTAAQRVLGAVPLAGPMRLEDALDAIAAAAAPAPVKVQAATALGELTACVLLLGETEAHAGALQLAVRPGHLHGLLEPVAA